MKIIGITGKKQSGKDTFANFVKQLLPEQKVVKISLAHPLKTFVIELLNISSRHVWGSDNDKNYPIAAWGKVFKKQCCEKYNKDIFDLLSGREALQVIGTDIMRRGNCYFKKEYWDKTKKFLEQKNTKIGNKIWIDLCVKDIQNQDADIVIVPDVRFFNEIEAIKKENGILVRMYRNIDVVNTIQHPSELEMEEMSDMLFDFVVDDDGNRTMNDLKQRVMNFIYKFNLNEGW